MTDLDEEIRNNCRWRTEGHTTWIEMESLEDWLADQIRQAEARGAEQALRKTAVEVRKYADTFDDIGSGGIPALLYGVAETIDNSANRIGGTS